MKKNTIPRKHKLLSQLSNDLLIDDAVNHPIVNFNTIGDSESNYFSVEESYRTEFRRHRDRILYTGAFRRLQDKTQVLDAQENGDHRTRLTHTLEVEQIAISIANALGLNSDLTSAIALGHDIGHTPFGHAGERALNDKLLDCGGFNHAIQSIRYIHYENLKLSNHILTGILLHDSDTVDIEVNKNNSQLSFSKDFIINKNYPSLEAQVVYWSDKLAYLTHDLEDFKVHIYNKSQKELIDNLDIKGLNEQLKNIIGGNVTIESYATRDLIRLILDDLICQSNKNITGGKCRDNTFSDKKSYMENMTINLSEKIYTSYMTLRKNLQNLFINSVLVQQNDTKAKNIINTIFDIIYKNSKLLPQKYCDLIKKESVKSVFLDQTINNIKKILDENINTIEDLLYNGYNKQNVINDLVYSIAEYVKFNNSDYFNGEEVKGQKLKEYIKTHITDMALLFYYKNIHTPNEDFDKIKSDYNIFSDVLLKYNEGKLILDKALIKDYEKYNFFIDKYDIEHLVDKLSHFLTTLKETDILKENFIIEQYYISTLHHKILMISPSAEEPKINDDEIVLINYICNNNFKDCNVIYAINYMAKNKQIICNEFLSIDDIENDFLFINRVGIIEQNNIKKRVIADYIASMTDKYASKIYNDLMGFNF